MSGTERAKPESEASGQSEAGGEPSMEDILASIRRILAEEEGAPLDAPIPTPDAAGMADDVLQLDASMMVPGSVPTSTAEPVAGHAPPLPTPPPAPAVAAPVPLAVETPLPPQIVAPPPAAIVSPPPPAATLMAPEAVAATATHVGSLVRTLSVERTTQVHSGGPTIEDLVRAELRPLLKQWLDANLPGMVERLVRAEIERVVGRAVP